MELSQQLKVEMPITQAIYQVLYENQDIKTVAKDIMLRDSKVENEFTKLYRK